MAILVDTGPLYALADAGDRHHEPVVEAVSAAREPLIVPGPVVPEVCYLLLSRLGPEAELGFLAVTAAPLQINSQPTQFHMRLTCLYLLFGHGSLLVTIKGLSRMVRSVEAGPSACRCLPRTPAAFSPGSCVSRPRSDPFASSPSSLGRAVR